MALRSMADFLWQDLPSALLQAHVKMQTMACKLWSAKVLALARLDLLGAHEHTQDAAG